MHRDVPGVADDEAARGVFRVDGGGAHALSHRADLGGRAEDHRPYATRSRRPAASGPTTTRTSRALLLERERLYNHLNDIGAICAGVGFAPGTMAFAALKDRGQRLNHHLTGPRFLFDTISVAASHLVLDHATVAMARQELRDLRSDAATAWRTLEFAGPLQARLDEVGVLSQTDAGTPRRMRLRGARERA